MKNYPLLQPLEGVSRLIYGERMAYYLLGSTVLDVIAMYLTVDPLIYYTMAALAFLSLLALALNHLGAAYRVDDPDYKVDASPRHLSCTTGQYYGNWISLAGVIMMFGTAPISSGILGILLWAVALNHVTLLFRLTCELDRISELSE